MITPQLAALQAQVQAQGAALQAQGAALQAQVAALQAQLQAMENVFAVRNANSMLRAANTSASRGSTLLFVLYKENALGVQPFGAQPAMQPAGPYPSTATDARELTDAQLDALAAFYAVDFGVGPPAVPAIPTILRRRLFALFIGLPEP
jgi:hypothetical protein